MMWFLLLLLASRPDVAVAPTPTHVGDVVTLSGCSYGRPKDLAIQVYGPDGSLAYGFATHTDATGCFVAVTGFAPAVAGVYEVYVFADKSAGDGQGTYHYNHATVERAFEVLE